MGFLPLLPLCGKSGKRIINRIFATFAIMWQKWQKDELWDFCTLAIMLATCNNVILYVKTGIMKSTKVQTLSANIWPGVDALKSCCTCVRLLENAHVNEHVTESIRKITKAKALYKLHG